MRDRDQLTNYLLIPLDKRRIRVFWGLTCTQVLSLKDLLFPTPVSIYCFTLE